MSYFVCVYMHSELMLTIATSNPNPNPNPIYSYNVNKAEKEMQRVLQVLLMPPLTHKHYYGFY